MINPGISVSFNSLALQGTDSVLSGVKKDPPLDSTIYTYGSQASQIGWQYKVLAGTNLNKGGYMEGPRFTDPASRAVFLFRKVDEGEQVTEEGMKPDLELMEKMVQAGIRVHDLFNQIEELKSALEAAHNEIDAWANSQV